MADNLNIFAHAIRIQESGDDYTATNASGHFGAYQFDISTWVYALNLAGIQYDLFAGTLPSIAPPSVQDAAALALMSKYYGEFGNSLFNVAEAWYGGPGAVGNPNLGGGPGFPTVGQYASSVIAIYNSLGGSGGGSPSGGSAPPPVTAATIAALDVALSDEAVQRSIWDQHSREQAAAGDDHTRQQLAAAVALEANQRAIGDADSRQQAAAGIKALDDLLTGQIQNVLKYAQSIPGTIDNRAAAGYDPTLQARANLLTKLLDTAVAHDPLVSGLVSNLATFIIDLAGIEDPIARIAGQLVLKQVIDRLGINTALGAILNDLVGSIFGGGQPKTLTDIMKDIGNRLDSLESGLSELAPLAPEADDLHELGTLIFDVAMGAYLVAAVTDPVATANDTVAVFAPITDPLLAPVRALLGM